MGINARHDKTDERKEHLISLRDIFVKISPSLSQLLNVAAHNTINKDLPRPERAEFLLGRWMAIEEDNSGFYNKIIAEVKVRKFPEYPNISSGNIKAQLRDEEPETKNFYVLVTEAMIDLINDNSRIFGFKSDGFDFVHLETEVEIRIVSTGTFDWMAEHTTLPRVLFTVKHEIDNTGIYPASTKQS